MSFKLLLILNKIIFVSIFSSSQIVGEEKTNEYQCAYHENFCHPLFQRPCCHENDTCKLISGFHLCTTEGQLGSLCQVNRECENIPHALCSENKRCTCRANNIENETCTPLLGAFCWKNETCATDNSICTDNVCKCRDGFIEQADAKCVLTSLGKACSKNSECTIVKFAECSGNSLCTCIKNTLPVNGTLCLPQLGVSCDENKGCMVKNSFCSNNRCECFSRYTRHLNSECKSVHLGMSCANDKDCILIDYSCCSEAECICKTNYFPVEDRKCAPKPRMNCNGYNDCIFNNSVCVNSNCQCKPGYVYRDLKCIKTILYQSCKEPSDCAGIPFAICSIDKICVCGENFVATVEELCAPIVGGFCSPYSHCVVMNSICVDHKCRCILDYHESDNKCIPRSLGKFCELDSDCKFIENSRCSLSLCVCNKNYRAVSKHVCSPTYNGYCVNDDQCKLHGFQCVKNKCQCKSNYTLLSSEQCVETRLIWSCIDITECSDSWHFNCIDRKCVCKENNIAIRTSTCLPTLDGLCWFDSQCVAENSVCIDYRCKCESNYKSVDNNICVSAD